MQFIITEHNSRTGYVNVCIFNQDSCLINILCTPEEIKFFRECQGDWEQLSMWIEWMKSYKIGGEFEDEHNGMLCL